MSKLVDSNGVIALLRRAVEEKGEDYEYELVDGSCVYGTVDGPSCIVGYVFDYLGVDARKIAVGEIKDEVLIHGTDPDYDEWGEPIYEVEYDNYRFDPDYYSEASLDDPELEFTKQAVEILAAAQDRQDRGTPWGEAVAKAVNA